MSNNNLAFPAALRRVLESVLPASVYSRTQAAWRNFLRVKREAFVTAYQRRRLWPKILDTPPVYTEPLNFLILAYSETILIFDADVLFFGCPDELLSAKPGDRCVLFQRDFADAYSISAAHSRSDYAGPSRNLLTTQGIPFLIRSGFLQSLKNDAGQKTPQVGWVGS